MVPLQTCHDLYLVAVPGPPVSESSQTFGPKGWRRVPASEQGVKHPRMIWLLFIVQHRSRGTANLNKTLSRSRGCGSACGPWSDVDHADWVSYDRGSRHTDARPLADEQLVCGTYTPALPCNVHRRSGLPLAVAAFRIREDGRRVSAHMGFPRTLTMANYLSTLFSTLNPILSVINLLRLECAETVCARKPRAYEECMINCNVR